MADIPQSTLLFCCCNGKAFTTILSLLVVHQTTFLTLSVLWQSPVKQTIHNAYLPVIAAKLLIAIQWRLPVGKTCMKGDSLITVNYACPKTGFCRAFTSGFSRLSIFCRVLIISSYIEHPICASYCFLRAATLSFYIVQSILL